MAVIKRIFHPTDLSAASETAFFHALKMAVCGRSSLTLMHVTEPNGNVHREDFPSIRTTLEQWGAIAPGSEIDAVEELGVSVRKVISHRKDPVEACQHYLESHAAGLVVLAVHQYAGVMRWLHHSVSAPIVQNTGEKALLLPHGVQGFVAAEDGRVSLRNILLPVAHNPRPQAAADAAHVLITQLGLTAGTVTLLHVGEAGNAPAIQPPADTQWEWRQLVRQGSVVETILQTADEINADLLIMPTEGRNGFFDALRGSTTERVLQRIACPLLTVPA